MIRFKKRRDRNGMKRWAVFDGSARKAVGSLQRHTRRRWACLICTRYGRMERAFRPSFEEAREWCERTLRRPPKPFRAQWLSAMLFVGGEQPRAVEDNYRPIKLQRIDEPRSLIEPMSRSVAVREIICQPVKFGIAYETDDEIVSWNAIGFAEPGQEERRDQWMLNRLTEVRDRFAQEYEMGRLS